MSLVGNFTQNYDRTSQQNGTGLARTTSSSSYYQDEAPSSPAREKSKLPTIPQHPAGGPAYPPTTDQLYPASSSNGDQASTPMSMTDTLHSRTQNVTSLARQMSRMSERPATNVFDYQEGSDMDPFSSSFDARKWTRGMVAMRDDDTTPPRQAGLSYKNMSVHGFGSDAGESPVQSPLGWNSADRVQTIKRQFQTCPYHGLEPSRTRSLETSAKSRLSMESTVCWNQERCSWFSVHPEGESPYSTMLAASALLLTLYSGCSTMLKTIAGEMNGLYLEDDSELNYRGITPKQMNTQFRGEAIYTAEVDVHFPKLTVGDTLQYVPFGLGCLRISG